MDSLILFKEMAKTKAGSAFSTNVLKIALNYREEQIARFGCEFKKSVA